MTKEKTRLEKYNPGMRKATSTSKTIKMIATKKNFIQKKQCETPDGSNPHS